jgi:hypothetical protein
VRLETYHSKISDFQARPLLDNTLEAANVEMIANVDGDADAVEFELSIEGNSICTRISKVSLCVTSPNLD